MAAGGFIYAYRSRSSSMRTMEGRRLSAVLLPALLCVWLLSFGAEAVESSEAQEAGLLAVWPESIEAVLYSGEMAQMSLAVSSSSSVNEEYVLEGVEVSPEVDFMEPGSLEPISWSGLIAHLGSGPEPGSDDAHPLDSGFLGSAPPRILVCHYGDDDRPAHEALWLALQILRWTFTVHPDRDFAGLKSGLARPSEWDLAIVLSSQPSPPPSVRTLIDRYVRNDGRLIWVQSSSPVNPERRFVGTDSGGKGITDAFNGLFPVAVTGEPCSSLLGEHTALATAGGGRTVLLDWSTEGSHSRESTGGGSFEKEVELWTNILTATVSKEMEWLRWDRSRRRAPPHGSDVIELALDASRLPAGEYGARLKIRGSDSCRNATVPVFLSVRAAVLPSLDLGTAEGFPGEKVTIPITLRNSRGLIGATSNDIMFSAESLKNPSAAIGPAGAAAGKNVSQVLLGQNVFRVGVFNLNDLVIQDGIVAYVTFTIRADAPAGVVTLYNSPSAASARGFEIQVDGANGAIVVRSQYAIEASAEGNGMIEPSGMVVVNEGSRQDFSIVPSEGSHVADVRVDGKSSGPLASYSFESVSANHSISASFETNRYTIAASAGEGGSIQPSGKAEVLHGADALFRFIPAPCYHIADVLVDGMSVGQPQTYSFNGVAADHAIQVVFAPNVFRIKAQAEPLGRIEPSGEVLTACGSNVLFTFIPNPGSRIEAVKVDGQSVGAPESHTFLNVGRHHRIRALFEKERYAILASASTGGQIAPAGQIEAVHGRSLVFRISNSPSYRISDVLVDGKSVGPKKKVVLSSIDRPHTIHAVFASTDTGRLRSFRHVIKRR